MRAYAGVRPLYSEQSASEGQGRDITRAFSILDHKARDGIENMVSIVGGKFTTYRALCEGVGDRIADRLKCARRSGTREQESWFLDELRETARAGADPRRARGSCGPIATPRKGVSA